ncbi:MAG: wax ester/triacylglycerol synthase family O-acyltransferase [Actinomycetota bacterium]
MPDRLSALDASFLYLETPKVHMHVGGLAILDPSGAPRPLTVERLRDLTASRLHRVPRFRQQVLFPPFGSGRPAWVDAADLALDFHVRRAVVPPPGGPRELADLTARIHSQQLDRGRPLWEMHLIDGLEDGYQATLTKAHHAMLDGIGGMDACALLLDHDPDPPLLTVLPWQPEPQPTPIRMLRDALLDRVTEPAGALGRTMINVIRDPRAVMKDAGAVAEGMVGLVRRGLAPLSPFNTAIGGSRRFAMTEISLDEARAVKRSLGGTVNDVILTTLAGALWRLLEHRGEPVEGRALRSLMPESLRTAADRPGQGNQVTTFFVDLPVGPMEATERLRLVNAETRRLKASHQDDAATGLIHLAMLAPPGLHAALARFGNGHQRVINLVASNVPGPQIPLYLDGTRLVAYYPLMPLGATVALSVGIVTLVGVMGFGFTADWAAFPDLELLAAYTRDSFDELRKAAAV